MDKFRDAERNYVKHRIRLQQEINRFLYKTAGRNTYFAKPRRQDRDR
ncbi:hypothetical protein [Mesonia sp.]|nr:hypothetical protein [Mesonia sp.]